MGASGEATNSQIDTYIAGQINQTDEEIREKIDDIRECIENDGFSNNQKPFFNNLIERLENVLNERLTVCTPGGT